MKKFKPITSADIEFFRSIIPDINIFSSEELLKKYGRDETEDLLFLPRIVLRPENAIQISSILKYCNEKKIPVTPSGGRTGLSGGALPVFGGVALSTEKLNKIISIDEKNLQVIVEPGVITQVLQETVITKNLFYPVDPSSRGTCTIGGNLSENAGGPRAVKYGVTKDYVLSLEVVLPTGEIINTGAHTLKNSTGYNLTQLMIGSEGTLGVITKAVLKLLPYPQHNVLMLVPFSSATKACEAVAAVFHLGIIPSALEFMERDAIDWTMKYIDQVPFIVPDHIQAHLLIELDGNEQDILYKDAEKISSLMIEYESDEILFADSHEQKELLWKLRRKVGEAVKSNSVYKEEDTVVPRYELPRLLEGVKSIGNKYGFKSVCYGHAGDGNLHVNIVKGDLSDDEWNNKLPMGIREIFELTVSLKGTLSGEHGIGYVQKNYMDIAFTRVQLDLMRGIKKLFDPNGILNPGKIFPDT